MSKQNSWHSVAPQTDEKDVVKGIIEIPRGSKGKYELDKESGLLLLDRVLHSSMTYPANYGFIPQTYCDDKDPLDILILSQVDIYPLTLVPARIVGVMKMIDGGEGDDKLIAVAADDPYYYEVNDLTDLPQHIIAEIRNFFETYKLIEKKKKVVSVEDFGNKEEALKVLEDSYKLYNETYGN